MKKKFLLTGSAIIAGAAILGLASCGTGTEKVTRTANNGTKTTHNYVVAPNAPTYTTELGTVDVNLNYAKTSGISRAKNQGSVTDPITNAQISEGTLMPTWAAYESYCKISLRDASDYSQSGDNNVWKNAKQKDFKNENDGTNATDLIYNGTGNFGTDADKLAPLDDYINDTYMPNFNAYLKANPDVKKMLTKGGHIYYTPYFDGQDDIERMFLMDTTLTKKVLDATEGWDTGKTNGGSNPAANVVQGGFYKPFVNADYNYPDKETKVKVLFENKAYEVTIFQTTNIIKQQNELLDKGCTGQELAQQFINYIKEAFKDLFENGYYANPSDLFVSDSAAFNADELIALMRVIKANPGMISGNADAEITTFFPRAASNNRTENIYDFAQIWGVQGVDGENGNFFIGGDGKVHALETTQASYDALDYLSQIYDEGLILKDFHTDPDHAGGNGTGFLDRFYKKTTANASYGFMMYDYSAANCAANDIEGGIGTKAEARKNGFNENYECKGITAVLAPLTYWGTESTWKPTQHINDFTGKTLTRYYESNRALKTNSWAIPYNADNKEGAVRLMDFMFSELGQMINNYGPTEYWAKPNTSAGDTVSNYDANKVYVADDLVVGELCPILSPQVKASISNQTGDFWTYSRGYLGSTHGIGNVRPMGVNLQATNLHGQSGVSNVQSAFTVGNNGVAGDGTVMKLATISKVKDSEGNTVYTWNTCAPSGFTSNYKDNDYKYGAITGFWNAEKKEKNEGWVAAVTRGHKNELATANIKIMNAAGNETTYAQVLSEFDNFNKNALYTYAYSIASGDKYVPDYAKIN